MRPILGQVNDVDKNGKVTCKRGYGYIDWILIESQVDEMLKVINYLGRT